MPFAIYKFEHADGPQAGLYIGGTFNPERRERGHREAARYGKSRTLIHRTLRRDGEKYKFSILAQWDRMTIDSSGDQTIAAAVERAWIEARQPNLNKGRAGAGFESTKARRVTIRGVAYPSHAAAAKALGCAANTITKAAARGTLDMVGVSKNPKPKPVTIRGVTYPSRTAAAEALGVTPPAIQAAVKHGYLGTVGLHSDRYRRKTP